MTRVLIVFPNLNNGVGPPRALVNMLNCLPQDSFEYDLLLTARRKDEFAHLWDRIPPWVNVLPPLYQLSQYSEDLMSELRSNGMDFAANIKEKVHALNAVEGVDYFRNWKLLKQLVPEYSGYDVAAAYTEDIALQIVCDRVSATRKIGWVHIDYRKAWDSKAISKKHERWSKMDKIVCVSKHNADVFAKCYEDLQDRIVTIYNPNDSEYIRNQADAFYPQEYKEAEDCLKVFSAGAICSYKGTDFIIDTVKQLVAEGYNIKWFIAGKPLTSPQDKGLEYVQRIKDEHLGEHLVLMGFKPNPYPYFANCDIYVHPSRYEGLAVAIQEAKVLCKPILITNHSSAGEVITDGETGILCDINAKSLTEKLRMMLDDKALRERLSANIKNSNENYDTQVKLKKLFEE